MRSLTVAGDLREAIHRAVTISEKRRAEKDMCPNPQCGKSAALVSLVFRAITVGRLCRFCEWNSFAFQSDADKGKLVRIK